MPARARPALARLNEWFSGGFGEAELEGVARFLERVGGEGSGAWPRSDTAPGERVR